MNDWMVAPCLIITYIFPLKYCQVQVETYFVCDADQQWMQGLTEGFFLFCDSCKLILRCMMPNQLRKISVSSQINASSKITAVFIVFFQEQKSPSFET